MNYSLTENALRKLICFIKEKIDNHKHKIDDVNGLRDELNKSTDYIIEQGTDTTGNWLYRKWESGLAECWCRQTYSTTIDTSAGDVYRSDALDSPAYPEGLFLEIPRVFAKSHGSGGYYTWSGFADEGTIESAGRIYLFRANTISTARSFAVNFEAVGVWKTDGSIEMTATHDGNGNVTVYNATATHDGNGHVTIL